MERQNILIVDDHPMLAEGLASLLKNTKPKHNAVVANCGAKAKEHISETAFDVAVVDVSLPDIDGIELVTWLRNAAPTLHIIIYTVHDEPWVIREMLTAGADAIVLKDDEMSEFVMALESVCAGLHYFSTRFQSLAESAMHGFTAREIEIMQHISHGMKSGDIAHKLFISENTVEYHRKKLITRFNAQNTAHMISMAIGMGLISPMNGKEALENLAN